MPLTRAQLVARIDALQEAIDQGVSSVSYDGRQVQYRSLDQLSRVLRNLETRLAEVDGQAVDSGRRYALFVRGY